MADTANPLFNKRAREKLHNPDELDKYVRVTNPSVWVILAACLAFLAGILVWGVFGTVSTSVSTKGVMIDDRVVCVLTEEDAGKVHAGNTANVNGEQMEVAKISNVPISRGEATRALSSDYLVSTLMNGDWAYWVTFEGDTSELAEGVPLPITITIERIPPIKLILGGHA